MRRDTFCNEFGPCIIVTRDHSPSDEETRETLPSPPMLDETMFDEPEEIE